MNKKEIHIPGDKSISHRAIMLGALAKGKTIVNNFLMSEDCLATVECFRSMGIEIVKQQKTKNKQFQSTNNQNTKLIIRGKGLRGLKKPKEILDVGNSGTTIRLMLGILAAQDFITEITGDSSIQKRPMLRVVKPLSEMGANIEGEYAPLKIYGRKLKGITYELPVASAQVKSAVLLAGLFADGKTKVIEKNPARDHTERMLKYFNAKPGQDFAGTTIDVPGDISSAAFFMVAGALIQNCELQMPNVGTNPTRMGIIEVLHRMGAHLEVQDEQILCEEPRANIKVQTSNLKGIKISGEIIPRIIDEIPIIALAATQAEGVTEISGAKELRVKESDRITTICSELKKIGSNIQEKDDGMIITGPTPLKGGKVKSYGDHRIAMMLSVANLIADGQVKIDDVKCIETSFPGFRKMLEQMREKI